MRFEEYFRLLKKMNLCSAERRVYLLRLMKKFSNQSQKKINIITVITAMVGRVIICIIHFTTRLMSPKLKIVLSKNSGIWRIGGNFRAGKEISNTVCRR